MRLAISSQHSISFYPVGFEIISFHIASIDAQVLNQMQINNFRSHSQFRIRKA